MKPTEIKDKVDVIPDVNYITFYGIQNVHRTFKPNETQLLIENVPSSESCPLVGASIANTSGNGSAEVIHSIAFTPASPTVDLYIYFHSTMPGPWAMDTNITIILFYHQY